MEAHFWGGIVRRQSPDGYFYTAKVGFSDLPVVFVSWFDAARYANWLSYGKPVGAQGLGTTEGDASHGSYDTRSVHPLRNAGANYVIPNCNEWSKAAYYNPATRKFSSYATPLPTVAGPATDRRRGAANVMTFAGWANPFPHLAPVTAYQASRSRTGTLNQAGNVMEWVEDASHGNRLILSGALFMNVNSTLANYRDSEQADHELSTLGIRIARLRGGRVLKAPEPVATTPKPSLRKQKPFLKFVLIDYADNPADPTSGRGSVPYNFEMQRTEITNGEYVQFLNAVASKADPFGLYRIDMSTYSWWHCPERNPKPLPVCSQIGMG